MRHYTGEIQIPSEDVWEFIAQYYPDGEDEIVCDTPTFDENGDIIIKFMGCSHTNPESLIDAVKPDWMKKKEQ